MPQKHNHKSTQTDKNTTKPSSLLPEHSEVPRSSEKGQLRAVWQTYCPCYQKCLTSMTGDHDFDHEVPVNSGSSLSICPFLPFCSIVCARLLIKRLGKFFGDYTSLLIDVIGDFRIIYSYTREDSKSLWLGTIDTIRPPCLGHCRHLPAVYPRLMEPALKKLILQFPTRIKSWARRMEMIGQ